MKRWMLMLAAVTAVAQERPSMPLSLEKAIEIAKAPDGATRVRIAQEAIRQAESRQRQALSALLPNFDASVGYRNFTQNLAAFGITFTAPILPITIPTLVGPVDVLDIRASGTQTVFDMAAIRRWQSTKAALTAVKADRDTAVTQTSGQVAKAYTNALRAEAVEEASRANVALAERIAKLARSQKEAGTGTGIDVVRADVQVATERQHLVAAEEDSRGAKLQLLRAIGLTLDGHVELTDRLKDYQGEIPTEAAALERAKKQRPELTAQTARTRSAQLNYESVRYERLPSVAVTGDYGTTGITEGPVIPTHTFGASLRIPIFDGGRRDARRAEAFSGLRQEQIRQHDTDQQVELEVRLAVDALRSARMQATVANEALGLSQKELEQAERRFEAGVASSVEVTDAQTRVARARETHANALARLGSTRVDLDVAVGDAPSLQ